MDIKKLLGKKIKQYRILRGFSQEKLSEMLGISQRTLSGIECGNNFLTSHTMNKILEVLKIGPDELFKIEHLKSSKELVNDINKLIKTIENDEEKLQLIYKIIKDIII